MMTVAYVAGVGMTRFYKPGQHQPYRVMVKEAVEAALQDAGIPYGAVQQAFGAYIYGDSTCGQNALYSVGMTGIPIINVNNNCSSGSTALFLARQAVASGAAECVLAFGFEEMQPGALASHWEDRESPFDPMLGRLKEIAPHTPAGPLALQMFGAAGRAYMERYSAPASLFAEVAVKTRAHALNNPRSLFNKPLTVEEVLSSPTIYDGYMTRLMACPPTCGAAAAIICSDAFAKRHGIRKPVCIAGQSMTTDTADSWDNPIDLIGAQMTKLAANQALNEAGVDLADVDVVELHDCFTPNEVITYEGLGLCEAGEAERFVRAGDHTYGGRFVVNPSGGLMSKGHPIGATGLAQCAELVWHLRGDAGARQVAGARVALQHNLGLGGAAVVTLYQA
ncbi:lipid-transfer protein [Neptunomonas marina]|uniref:propanoyl-CoA C-acyltransferase n=2 Tax=Neptunomonas marina TaxID=1815562 RepID=A0A437Q8C0_9GAMM|nr:lipid-transfer protein [Neptunomonas marina]